MDASESPLRLLALATCVAAACRASPSGAEVPPLPVVAAPCTSRGRTAQRIAVSFPERGTATRLAGAVFAPAQPAGTLPTVSLLPGGGAGISSVEWAACALAADGYVVVVTQPSSGVSTGAYHTAAVSGIDFLVSAANPFRAASDPERVGVAGWSLGARSLTRTQAEDPWVDALVAWDDLAVSENGEAGSPACTNQPGTSRTPRVPALGQAWDTCTDRPADAKKTAYAAWRAAGVPAMQVVFAGATHFLWSARFRSAAGFDGRSCEDLRAGC